MCRMQILIGFWAKQRSMQKEIVGHDRNRSKLIRKLCIKVRHWDGADYRNCEHWLCCVLHFAEKILMASISRQNTEIDEFAMRIICECLCLPFDRVFRFICGNSRSCVRWWRKCTAIVLLIVGILRTKRNCKLACNFDEKIPNVENTNRWPQFRLTSSSGTTAFDLPLDILLRLLRILCEFDRFNDADTSRTIRILQELNWCKISFSMKSLRLQLPISKNLYHNTMSKTQRLRAVVCGDQ